MKTTYLRIVFAHAWRKPAILGNTIVYVHMLTCVRVPLCALQSHNVWRDLFHACRDSQHLPLPANASYRAISKGIVSSSNDHSYLKAQEIWWLLHDDAIHSYIVHIRPSFLSSYSGFHGFFFSGGSTGRWPFQELAGAVVEGGRRAARCRQELQGSNQGNMQSDQSLLPVEAIVYIANVILCYHNSQPERR